MPLTINTNVSSIIAQRSMESATKALNTSLERMTTGYKINHAQDNAAGYSIAKIWTTQLSSLDVAADNAAIGANMLTTAEDTYNLLTSHLQRIRDLTEQAGNGTYGSQSLRAIHAEVVSRLQEVNRIAANSEFNGIKLMAYVEGGDNSDVGLTDAGVNLQVGLYANENSQINLDISLFSDASLVGLFANDEIKAMTLDSDDTITFEAFITHAGGSLDGLKIKDDPTGTLKNMKAFAAACTGFIYDPDDADELDMNTEGKYGAKEMLKFLDYAINDISTRVTNIGATQNRVTSALTALDVQSQNITSSLSTLRDTDVAEESSNYIQSQILQQASATLLSTANQLPSVALNLI